MALSGTADWWWKLNEASGTAVANSGSFGTPAYYDGVLTQNAGGSYSWDDTKSWGSGGITGSLDLAPSDEITGYSVHLDNHLPLETETKVTIAFWMRKETGGAADGRIFFQGDTWSESDHQYMIGLVGSTNIRQRINGSTYADTGNEVTQDTDTHFVAVLDFTATPELSIYKDGNATPVYTASDVSGEDINADTDYPNIRAIIGASAGHTYTTVANMFSGLLSDIRIWLDAATPAEVTAIYENTLGEGGGSTVSPAELGQAHSLDSPTLVQDAGIVAAELGQAHSLDSPTLIQAYILSPGQIGQSHTIAPAELAIAGSLAPAELEHVQTLDIATLDQASILTPVDLSHENILDTVALSEGSFVVPVALFTEQNIDQAIVTAGLFPLRPDGLINANSLDDSQLTQAHILFVDDLLNVQTIDAAALLSGVYYAYGGRIVKLSASGRYLTIDASGRYLKIY